VDSSVGGKTGVDLPEGKNLVGTFSQPAGVFIDPDVLHTLPDDQFIAGLAEVIKYGVIRDPDFLAYLDAHREPILARRPDALIHVIKTCCADQGGGGGRRRERGRYPAHPQFRPHHRPRRGGGVRFHHPARQRGGHRHGGGGEGWR
jgi:hypothetical protein